MEIVSSIGVQLDRLAAREGVSDASQKAELLCRYVRVNDYFIRIGE